MWMSMLETVQCDSNDRIHFILTLWNAYLLKFVHRDTTTMEKCIHLLEYGSEMLAFHSVQFGQWMGSEIGIWNLHFLSYFHIETRFNQFTFYLCLEHCMHNNGTFTNILLMIKFLLCFHKMIKQITFVYMILATALMFDEKKQITEQWRRRKWVWNWLINPMRAHSLIEFPHKRMIERTSEQTKPN